MPFAGMGHFVGIIMDIVALALTYILLSKIVIYYEDEFKSVNSHNRKVRQHHEDVREFEKLQEDYYGCFSENDAPEWDVDKNGYCRYWMVDSKAFAADNFAEPCWFCTAIYLIGCIICHIIAIIF